MGWSLWLDFYLGFLWRILRSQILMIATRFTKINLFLSQTKFKLTANLTNITDDSLAYVTDELATHLILLRVVTTVARDIALIVHVDGIEKLP